MHMPGMDGFQFLQLIQTEPRLDRLRVCILTGAEVGHGQEVMRRLGAESVLIKPATVASFPELCAAVVAVLGGSVPPAAMILRQGE